ncbi:MAG: nuclear transport factor 2 family protein, partial [Prolixibacteraceae bacterium]|nr:nuclear transport factor 2 family protein [Prolixibacteraceae bacterium]
MKKSSFLVLLACCLSTFCIGQTDQKKNKDSKSDQWEVVGQQQILQLEELVRKAKVDNDVKTLGEIFADEYKGLNQYGVATTKVGAIANWANRKNTTIVLDSVTVTLNSKTTAVAQGLQTEDGVQMRFEHSLVKQGEQWRIVSVRQKLIEFKGTKGI